MPYFLNVKLYVRTFLLYFILVPAAPYWPILLAPDNTQI